MANVYNIQASGGLRVPVLTADPVSPINGSIWYNSTSNVFKKYENGAVVDLGGAAQVEFSDDDFAIFNEADNTKRMEVDVSAITTGTTRTLTMADADVDLADVNTAIQRDGSVTMDADLDMATDNKIINLADPTNAQDAATKAYVDAIAQGLSPKGSVRAASLVDIDISSELEDGDVVDGVTLATGDRVLLKNQTDPIENGVYIVAASGAAARASDFNGDPENEVKAGDWVYVSEGTDNGGSSYAILGNGNIEVGVDEINFTKINQVTPVQAGDAVSISSDEINVLVDGTSISINGSNELEVADGLSAEKIANGQVSDTEFQYLDGVTSSIQGQLDDKLEAADIAGKADTDLGNLASTAINTNLLPDTSATHNLGSGSLAWNTLFAERIIGTDTIGLTLESAFENTTAFPIDMYGSSIRRGADSTDTSALVEEEYLDVVTLDSNTTDGTFLALDSNEYQGFIIEYSMLNTTTNDTRVGTLKFVVDGQGGSGTEASIVDDYTETANLNISFDWDNLSAGSFEILYTNGSATDDVEIRADVKKFRAWV